MSDLVTQSEVEDVLSSVRRLVGDTDPARRSATSRRPDDKLVLTPQLRVTDTDVLVLRPEDAVERTSDWQEFEKAPMRSGDDKTAHEGPGKIEPFILENAIVKRPAAARTDVTELTAKIAALETAIAKTVDQWEPDGAGRDAYSGTQMPAMDWPFDVELDATGKPMKPPSDLVVSAVGDKLAQVAKDQAIDEDMLRQIVSEVVRAELQGALGERITRNVRKLIRREIHQVLLTQSQSLE